jgi:cytochrome b561
MRAAEEARGWSQAQRLAHWLTAALVAIGIAVAIVMVRLPLSELRTKFWLYQIHKSIGLVVLAIVLARLALRAAEGRPGWSATLSAGRRKLAARGHVVLYALLLIVPTLGYLTAASAPFQVPTLFLGLFAVPHVIAPDPTLYANVRLAHWIAATLLGVLALGHAGIAIAAHRDGDAMLRRMWSGAA